MDKVYEWMERHAAIVAYATLDVILGAGLALMWWLL